MKKVLSTVLTVVVVLAVCLAVYVFAFEKKVSAEWVTKQIEAVKTSKFSEDGNAPKIIKYYYEKKNYTQDGETTVTTYEGKVYRGLKDNSTETEEAYEIRSINYNENGEVEKDYVTKYYKEDGKFIREENGEKKELEDFSEITFFYLSLEPFYEDDGTLKDDVKTMVDENLESVTSKGLNITLHLVKDNYKVNISYGFISKKIVKIEYITDTLEGDVVTNTVREIVEY